MKPSRRFPVYGMIGIGVMLAAEVLMLADFRPVSCFFTPIVWTGYILLADAWLVRSGRSSFIRRYGPRFVSLCVYSVFLWVLFEYYNLLLKNWYYVNLPDRWSLRMLGYLWSFATILPGILVTAEVIRIYPRLTSLGVRKIRVTPKLLNVWVAVGFLFLTIPLVSPSPYLFAPVWLGLIFLLDPINYRLGKASLLGDFERADGSNFYSVLLGGFVCGLLWEFWNYWAYTKWIYTVPILPQLKIFEMPVLGFLGFGPFALECYVATNLVFSQRESSSNP